MMNIEFDLSTRYFKKDNIIENSNYEKGYFTKNVKSKFGEFESQIVLKNK